VHLNREVIEVDGSHVEKVIIKKDGTLEAVGVLDALWSDCRTLSVFVSQGRQVVHGHGRPDVGAVNAQGEQLWTLKLVAGGAKLAAGTAYARALGVMLSGDVPHVRRWTTRKVPVATDPN